MAEVGRPRHGAGFSGNGGATRVVGAALVAALASVLAVHMVPASALRVVYTPTTHAAEAVSPVAHVPAPKVLFIGDSLMDQQGSAAAFLLRQNGINAKSLGEWGTSLLTRDEYDNGRTIPTGGWLLLAAQQVKSFDP